MVLLAEWSVGVRMAASEIRGQQFLQLLVWHIVSQGRDGCRQEAEHLEQLPGEARSGIVADLSHLLSLCESLTALAWFWLSFDSRFSDFHVFPFWWGP